MPYQLVQDGLVREFRLFAPIGWPYWVERAFTEDGRNGLPLVIAMHGGAQDPNMLSDRIRECDHRRGTPAPRSFFEH